ncbi:unnamed protein product [Arctogadus glacialis]
MESPENSPSALDIKDSHPAGHHHQHHHHNHHTLPFPTSALPEAAEGPLGRKDPPMSSGKGEDPYMAVPSQTLPEANAPAKTTQILSWSSGRSALLTNPVQDQRELIQTEE